MLPNNYNGIIGHFGIDNSNRLYVKSGDKVYVRLHKSKDTNVEIYSDPEITYIDENTGADIYNSFELAQDQFYLNNGSYASNFLVNNELAPVLLDAEGRAVIKVNSVYFPYTTDDFTFKIIKDNINANTSTVIYSKLYSQSDVGFSTENIGTFIPFEVTVLDNEPIRLRFVVESDSYTSFLGNNWTGKINVLYNAITPSTPTGSTAVGFNTVPQYPSFAVTQFSEKFDLENFTIMSGVHDFKAQIKKNITNYSELGVGSFYYIIKRGSTVITKRKIIVDGTNSSVQEEDMISGQPISGILPAVFFTGNISQIDSYKSHLITIQVFCNTGVDYNLYKKYAAQFQGNPFNIYFDNNIFLTDTAHTSINSAMYNNKTKIYNNWGQFLYNPTQDFGAGPGTADYFGALIKPQAFPEDSTQQIYLQCQQYYNDQQALADCVANSTPNPGTGNSLDLLITPMKPYIIKNKAFFDSRWVGTAIGQFTSAGSFKADDTPANYFGNPIPDPAPAVVASLASGQVSVDTTMKSIDKKSYSTSKNVNEGSNVMSFTSANSVTELLNPAGSVVSQDFMDVNGDGYPDMIYAESMQLTNATGGLLSGQTNPVSGYPTDNFSLQQMNAKGFSYSSYSVGGRIDAFGDSKSSSKSDNSLTWSAGVSLGVGVNKYYESTDYGKEFWIDLNGDGLPDRVRYGGTSSISYSLNLGKHFGNSEKFENLVSYRSHPLGGINASIGGGLSGLTDLQSLSNFGFGISANVGASSSKGTSDRLYEDVNGDGLIDILEIDNNNKTTNVRYNLGNKFDVAVPLLKTGSAVDFTEDTHSYNGSLSFGGNLMINFGPITIVPIFPILLLYIKAGAGANANFGLNISDTKKIFKDMNGDGFVDLVVDNGGDSFKVNYSRIGRTNKLKQVTSRITQSKYIVDYQFTQPNYQDPHAKLVVKEVKILNPDVFDSNYTNSDNSKDMVTQYEFKNSKYDRRERDNFGFETVIRKEMEGTSTVFRKSVDTYYNKSYFLNGMIKESKVLTGNDVLLSKVNYGYQLYKFKNNTTQLDIGNSLFNTDMENFDTGGKEGRKMATVLLYEKIKTVYENGGSILTTEQMKYTDKGLISNYQYVSPTKSYNSVITYWDSLNNNIITVPKEINVYQGTTPSALMRKRKSLNPDPLTGDIRKFVIFDGSNDIETDITYNANGNIASVQYPPNENGQRYMLSYQYDTQTDKYVASVMDSLGLTSTTEYYPQFDAVKKSVDVTGNVMEYIRDSVGRIVVIKGPNEFGGNSPTIQYDYYYGHYGIPNNNPDVKIFRSRTSHFDQGTPFNTINIDTYADYLGRVIQVKKDIEINGVEQRSVSGRPIFDIHGRAIRQYHPTVEPLNALQNINLSLATNFSATQYDILDRVVQEMPETGVVKNIKYEIAGNLFKTTEEFDFMNTETYTNTEGQITKKVNYLDTIPLETVYQYNPAGDLISVTDPENISTTYSYNLAGRRIAMEHADKGTLQYHYDLAGNLIRLFTPNLVYDPNGPSEIHYLYDYKNNLTDIVLPDLPNGSANPNNVHYGYSGPNSGNNSGKLTTKSDGTGNITYTYGKMGEVVSENRTVYGYNVPTMNFKTDFSYDSWNRIKKIKYPDGEEVSYKYDLGGNLKSVSNNDQDYIKNITYNLYEQRTRAIYGNGTETSYGYYPANMRLGSYSLRDATNHSLLSNSYSYDKIGNITKLSNSAEVSPNGMGGAYSFTYKYDTLNRLIGTEGDQIVLDKGGNPIPQVPSPFPESNSMFSLKMEYTESGGIASKMQKHTIDQQLVIPNNYNNIYKYNPGTHKLKEIIDLSYANSGTYAYDLNGNMIWDDDKYGKKRMFWDEQDRMKAFYNDDSGVYQYYAYDDKGERTIKYNLSTSSQLYQNGVLVDPGSMTLKNYKLYPNPYVVVTSDGQYTKNYFEGSTRFASRIKDGTDIFIPTTTKGATTNPDVKEIDPETDFKTYLEKVGVEGKISVELVGKSGGAGGHVGLYYLHTDHLGTASFVTDDNSKTTQFFLNLPFGETMLEQQTGVYDNPYKFNAKELDKETGLYYYGARYYNPKLSVWYSVDPLAVYSPVMETQFYGDGQHNGGVYNWGNLNPYIYTYQNPINLIDPNGKQSASGAHSGGGYRGIGVPIPMYEHQGSYLPFPTHTQEEFREGFDKLKDGAKSAAVLGFNITVASTSSLWVPLIDKYNELNKRSNRVLNSDILKPENGYLRGQKHGIKWQSGDAKKMAEDEKLPQGKWGSKEDLGYAGEMAGTLEPGPLKNGKVTPGDFQDFPINPGSTSTVYNPNGTQSKPDRIRVRNNGNGTFHGFPIDSKTAGQIHKKN